MAELDVIRETLRRQRKDLEDQLEDTSARTTETAGLLDRIEQLRARAERTQQRVLPPRDESKPEKN